jgi:PhzF family phenazine biosynthesis protein
MSEGSGRLVYQVDAFTDRLFSGNPAGVVPEAEGLDEAAMLAIARELNNSETAFVFRDGSPDYDYRVRFFTPTREVPICGHATVAAHYVLAKRSGIVSATLLQSTGAGILPVEVSEDSGDLRITMTQAAVEFGTKLEGTKLAALLRGLGIGPSEMDPASPAQIVSTGHSKVMIPLRSRASLDSLRPDDGLMSALSAEIGCNGYYPFTFDSGEEGVLTSGRMFAPAIGIKEDPVTGNASGPLGAYLLRYGLLDGSSGRVEFDAKQGEAIGRKGYVRVIVDCEGREARRVRISGLARIVFSATIEA